VNMRIVVPPPWESIVLRAAGYGIGYGAAAGATALVAPSLIAAMLGYGAQFLGLAMLFWSVAAVGGALVGLACGLAGGITLVVLRRQAAASRAAARLVSGMGAALLPGLYSLLVRKADGFEVAAALILALAAFVIGVASGPRVLYGKPRPRRRAGAEADLAAMRR
jgi:hypothetical protein